MLKTIRLNGWYDWTYNNGNGQGVAILPQRHLPSSIQLEESRFGYPVYPVHSDDYKWPWEDIIKGGGWGMRWLGPSVDNGIDLSCEIVEYDPSPVIEEIVNHKIIWKNNKNREQTVLCEIYSGDYLVTSYALTIPGNSSVTRNTRLIYHATKTHKMIAKINYANRYSETNPNNNTSTVTVIPRSSDKPAIDYGVYFSGVETPEPNGYGQVEVTWKNYKSLCKKTNVHGEKVFPHNLRHLFARSFYSIDKDIAKLADVLGHSNINTTRLYLTTSGKEHRRLLDKVTEIIHEETSS